MSDINFEAIKENLIQMPIKEKQLFEENEKRIYNKYTTKILYLTNQKNKLKDNFISYVTRYKGEVVRRFEVKYNNLSLKKKLYFKK